MKRQIPPPATSPHALCGNGKSLFKFLASLMLAVMAIFWAEAAIGQQKVQIKGVVYDSNNTPVYGAAVTVNGTNQGMTTAENGSFALSVTPSANLALTVSFVGMETQVIPVGSQTNFKIILKSAQLNIDEVVVTGYGNIAKESYTGSANVISSSKLELRPAGTFEELLGAQAPGVVTTGLGQPGGEMDVRIRGIGSMEASNQPLYVVDGVVWDQDNLSGSDVYTQNPLTTLNPADIASMTILKDASSASLYGSRGANGVIVITTKQGRRSERIRYNISAQAGVSTLFYHAKPDMVDGRTYANLWVEGEMHRLIRKVDTSTDIWIPELKNLYADKSGYTYQGKTFYEWQKEARQNFNSFYAMPKADGSRQNYENYDYFGADWNKLPNTDWWDEVTRVAPFYKINFSASGGTKEAAYYASLEYYNQQGIIINSQLQRISGRVNLAFNNPKRLINWGVRLNVATTEQSGPRKSGEYYGQPQFAATILPPVIAPYLEDGSYNVQFPNNILNSHHNPLASVYESVHERPTLNINGSVWAQVNIMKGFKFKTTVSEYFLYAHRKLYRDKDQGDGYGSGGSLLERDQRRLKIVNSNMFTYEKKFGHHKINVVAGVELETLKNKYNSLTAVNFSTDLFPYVDMAGDISDVSGGGNEWSLFSIVTKLDYNYRNRYLIGGSYRQDRSSYFAPEYRAGNFWSVSAAWRVSNERFFRRAKRVIDDLKIKASYGTNGTLPSSSYRWRDGYSSALYENSLAVYSSYRPTHDLTWEKNNIYNVGFDISLLKRRLKVSAEYYGRKSSDLLRNYPVSHASGYETVLMNTDAGIYNNGVDVDIFAEIVRKKDWKWNVSLNFATLQSEYYGLDRDTIGRQIMKNGESVRAWYLYEFAGINPDTGQNWIWRYKEETDPETGEVKTVKYKGTGYSTYVDRRVVGKAIPTVTGGLNTKLEYRNWELSMLFSFALDYQIYDLMGSSVTQKNGYSHYAIERPQLDRWTPDHPYATYPVRINTVQSALSSTRYLHEGDYLKLKNLRLTYNLPTSFLKKIGLRSASVFVQGENIFCWTAMENYDPEMSTTGYRYNDRYPTVTTWTGGVRINF